MDPGPVDARLMPTLALPEVWVVLQAAGPGDGMGPATLLAADPDRHGVLAGVEVPGGGWRGTTVTLRTADGAACTGTVDRVAQAAWVPWGAAVPAGACGDTATCPDELAGRAWDARQGTLWVAHLDGGLRCAGKAAWGRVASAGPLAPLPARPVPDALANLAVASFRRLPAWGAVQARWLRDAQPLDASEWDNTGGAVPEVAWFEVPGRPAVVTVAAEIAPACGGFSAELSVVFEVRTVGARTELAQVSPAGASAPGFAPAVAEPAPVGWRFGAEGRTGDSEGQPTVDGRLRRVEACPAGTGP